MPRPLRRAARGALPVALAALAACASPPDAPPAPVNARGGVALRGYDPVAYFADGTARSGDAAHAALHGGALYRFASDEHRRRFEADPERYLPRYGGYCAIAMAWDRIADVDPEAWAVVDGRLYLNNSAFAQALWSLGRGRNIAAADRNWERRRRP